MIRRLSREHPWNRPRLAACLVVPCLLLLLPASPASAAEPAIGPNPGYKALDGPNLPGALKAAAPFTGQGAGETDSRAPVDPRLIAGAAAGGGILLLLALLLARSIRRRKQAEEALRESETRYRSLLDHTELGITVITGSFTITAANPARARRQGTSPEDLVGRTCFQAFRGLDGPCGDCPGQEVLRTGRPVAVERVMEHEDGSRTVELVRAFPLLDPGGSRTSAFIEVTEDITERKEAEEALKLSVLQWKTTFDAIADSICLQDTEGTLVQCNRATLSMLEQPFDDLLGKKCWEAFHGSDSPVPECPFVRMKESLKKETLTLQDGSQWFEVSVHPVFGEDGALAGAVHVAEDITSRKRAEEALRESEERFRQMAENIQEVFWMCEPMASRFLYASPALEHLWPCTVQELYRDPGKWTELVHPDDVEEMRRNWARQLDGTPTQEVFRLILPGVGTRWIANRAYPIRDREGLVSRVAGIAEDVTEQKETNEERRRLEHQLQQAQKMEAVGTLAGGIAHDFNNLLQTIQGYAQLLLMGRDEDDPDVQKILAIDQAAGRAGELTRQLLAFSRKMESKPRPVDLNRQLHQLQRLLQRTIPKMIQIELCLDESLGLIMADPVQLEQVVMNLCLNARDAMPEGGLLRLETTAVTIGGSTGTPHPELKEGAYHLLAVSDTGQGMEPELIERVFEPFFTTKAPGAGTGLGLPMVYGIVKNHAGHIECESTPGRGTTFRVYWPAGGELAKEAPQPRPPLTKGGGETILLVDDEAAVRSLVEEILGRFGYRVLTASSGEKALKLFEAHRGDISLVILDLIMPGMGGMKCLEELLAVDPDAKVLVASGYSAGESVRDALKIGAREFIRKPYGVRELLRIVKSTLTPVPGEASSPKSP